MLGDKTSGCSVGDGECTRETDRAILVFLADIGEEYWVPKSVVDDDSEVWERGQEGEVVVQEWWARDRGLV